MKQLPLLVAVMLPAGLLAAGEPAVKRLDGSSITTAQIDQTVTRLMRAAEVTGVGLAILDPHTIRSR